MTKIVMAMAVGIGIVFGSIAAMAQVPTKEELEYAKTVNARGDVCVGAMEKFANGVLHGVVKEWERDKLWSAIKLPYLNSQSALRRIKRLDAIPLGMREDSWNKDWMQAYKMLDDFNIALDRHLPGGCL